ncbi:hypothetical protein C8F04DRAFT_1117186 [Mycena alexandri]|uniref:NAD(P)-binding protein n=1 Tax=Mycena alexandri TaxID=1745969 RepID=A0AAD6WZI6_9AGAR|nr:hypothetical protein C8F04DRAFT_1117186 [Mycena alexandri]
MTLRTILVTGSNQGLGMHIVHQLASTPNVLVFMSGSSTKFVLDVHPSSTVVPVQLDITDDNSVTAAQVFISDFIKEKGLQASIFLSSSFLKIKTPTAISSAAIGAHSFKAVYEVNIFGTVAVTDAFRPLLNNDGTILNVSSGLGSISAYTRRPAPLVFPAYASSKTALNALTVQWELQEEQKGSAIRVVSIDPGHNRTNLNKFTGGMPPADGCKVIVDAALEKGGKTAVFLNRDGEVAWWNPDFISRIEYQIVGKDSL